MELRVLVADDQALVRGSFRLLVDTAPGLRAVGEAGTGAEAVELAERERPDLVLMDVRMPEMDGIEATRRICADLPEVRVLILTTFDLDSYVYAALRAGASGFLLKDAGPDEILAAIRVVHEGQALLAPSVTRRVVSELLEARARVLTPHPRIGDLTAREREVVALVGRGLSNDEIASELVLSPATARTHVSRAMIKLGARDRAQLVVFAYQSGLVD